MQDKKEPILVAVYGSLRSGFHNHSLLSDSKLLGTFDTEPIYDMYSCGSFPGLVLHGSTSIKMEIYEVTEEVSKKVERLEGYTKGDEMDNHYNKVMIDTPYGEAGTYIYNNSTTRLPKVDSGDWKVWREIVSKNVKQTVSLWD
jgi:gamma-glutamylcyclotransferase (GGCT)/AIG2-like uncharacterized protein YtfP